MSNTKKKCDRQPLLGANNGAKIGCFVYFHVVMAKTAYEQQQSNGK